ncbi:MAG: hypothetical protein LUI13_13965 [Lachnospiraceae bacterium]|nr:hypothetical protein [Lachnospiraceae bacterium]
MSSEEPSRNNACILLRLTREAQAVKGQRREMVGQSELEKGAGKRLFSFVNTGLTGFMCFENRDVIYEIIC